jgi:mono/diheme cytochrome c family protein
MKLNIWLFVCAGLIAVLGLAGCANPNPQPAGLTPIPSLAAAQTATLLPEIQNPPTGGNVENQAGGAGIAAAGAATYEQNCSACHGNQGEGVVGPALRNNSFIQSGGDAAVAAVVSGGRMSSGMPAWLIANGGPLSTGQVNNVVAFLHSFQNVKDMPKATPMPPAPTDVPGPTSSAPEEAAAPSLPGGPGAAVGLTGDAKKGMPLFGQFCAPCHGPQGVLGIPNTDSDDGSVPALNPIDETIANKDLKQFASAVDLFVEHGSVPAGPAPQIAMPSFGDGKLLLDQQIADVIAYVISLNSGQ